MRGILQALPEIDLKGKEKDTEQQRVEGQFQGGDSLQEGSVDGYNINSIEKGGGHYQKDSQQAQCVAVIPLVEQSDAAQGDHDAENRELGQLFMKAKRHDERDHDGIDKQQRGGNAGGHEVVALEEC